MCARISLALCGDIMTGRGVDQAFATSCDPVLYERSVRDARRYLELAEHENGSIPAPISPGYPWGDARSHLDQNAADLFVGNLETSITTHSEPWEGKGIHYRMHPENTECLKQLGLDCASLANNHVLDWGRDGLEETLSSLNKAGIQFAGAGRRLKSAAEAAKYHREDTRLLVFGIGTTDSGIPQTWEATASRSGVHLLPDYNRDTIGALIKRVQSRSTTDDLVICSIHWGGNWGWNVPDLHEQLAHRLIEEANVDLIHGHSSHHPKPLDVHDGKLILYGCGDLMNDYKGISGHESYRGDLSVLYRAEVDPESGVLQELRLHVFQIHRMRLRTASTDDTRWLMNTLNRHGEPFDSNLTHRTENELVLRRLKESPLP